MSEPFEACFCGGPWDGVRKWLDREAVGCDVIKVAVNVQRPNDWHGNRAITSRKTFGPIAIYRPLKGQSAQYFFNGYDPQPESEAR